MEIVKNRTMNHRASPTHHSHLCPDPAVPVNSPWWQPPPRAPSFDLSECLAAITMEIEDQLDAMSMKIAMKIEDKLDEKLDEFEGKLVTMIRKEMQVLLKKNSD